jgi:DNA-binding transcriptional MocR family regulator
MSVHRLAKYQTDDPFTRVPNAAVEDERLDLRSRGLLLFMLSKPDGWTFRERALAKQAGVGRDQVRSAMQKLIEAGYVRRRWESRDDGPPAMVTEVYDRSQDVISEIQPEVGFPEVGNPDRGETRPLSNEGFQVTKEVSNSSAVKKKSVRSQKCGLPASWQPDDKQVQQLREKFPKLGLDDEAEKFQDYHRAKGSSFVDWDAAFRNWCRNAEKFRLKAAGMSEDGFR